MAWPDAPQSLADIPMAESDRQWLGSVDPATASAVCGFLNTHAPMFEMIAGGDEDKEQRLGSLFVSACIMSANVRERTMRGMPTP